MTEEETAKKKDSSSNESLASRFSVEREEWKDKVESYSIRFRDIYQMGELLTDLYSSRQIVVEYLHTLMSHMTKLNRVFREKKVERHEFYTRNYDVRLDKDVKFEYVMNDIAIVSERRELLQTHIDYFRETIKTIDTMCYGVKHRIALEEYRRG
jgi:hypothetical protein